jgi:hypothetical protein
MSDAVCEPPVEHQNEPYHFLICTHTKALRLAEWSPAIRKWAFFGSLKYRTPTEIAGRDLRWHSVCPVPKLEGVLWAR